MSRQKFKVISKSDNYKRGYYTDTYDINNTAVLVRSRSFKDGLGDEVISQVEKKILKKLE